jgi:hypothetical protein
VHVTFILTAAPDLTETFHYVNVSNFVHTVRTTVEACRPVENTLQVLVFPIASCFALFS